MWELDVTCARRMQRSRFRDPSDITIGSNAFTVPLNDHHADTNPSDISGRARLHLCDLEVGAMYTHPALWFSLYGQLCSGSHPKKLTTNT
eukprot:gene8927-biopygen2464